MLRSLLYKEFRLTAHPITYIFLLCGAMVMIPSYPYYVAYLYVCLGLFFSFLNGREQRDLYYCAVLPVTKRAIVEAKCLFCVLVELTSLLLTVPWALLSALIGLEGGNAAGIEPNPAFFGLSLLMFGIFNRLFLPGFFKTGYKLGIPLMLGLTAITLYIGAAETLTHLPVTGTFLSGIGAATWGRQWPVLLGGIGLYGLLTWWAMHISSNGFECVDL